MRQGARVASRRYSDRVVLPFRAGTPAAPILPGCLAVEQPLHTHACRRIEDPDRVLVPPAVDQQRTEAATEFLEQRRGFASLLANPAVFVDDFAVGVPEDQASGST